MTLAHVAGYLPIGTGNVRGFAYEPAAEVLEAAVRQHGTLRAWARARSDATIGGGRVAVVSLAAPVTGPDGRSHWVCRHYVRGGLVATLLHDRYLRVGDSRPIAELLVSQRARSRGVRTPAVVAAAAYTRGPFYRADLVTELVPQSMSLADALFGSAAPARRDAFLTAAGRLVHSLESAGLLHVDLNAHNVLVPSAPSSESGDAWVLDLDRCRVHDTRTRSTLLTMRTRLERSLLKSSAYHPRPLTASEWDALRGGYATAPPPPALG